MNKQHGEKLYANVFQQLRARMLSKKMRPGDRIPTEKVLSEEMGVSRNVLREAMKSLELMGVVSSQPGRGTVLKDFDLEFVIQNVLFFCAGQDDNAVKEMLEIRKKLELSYMGQAYQTLGEKEIIGLRGAVDAIRERAMAGERYGKEDQQFHMMLFQNLGNSTLSSLLNAIWMVDLNLVGREQYTGSKQAIEAHERIVHGLEIRNQEMFEAGMLAHFASGRYSMAGSYSEY